MQKRIEEFISDADDTDGMYYRRNPGIYRISWGRTSRVPWCQGTLVPWYLSLAPGYPGTRYLSLAPGSTPADVEADRAVHNDCIQERMERYLVVIKKPHDL